GTAGHVGGTRPGAGVRPCCPPAVGDLPRGDPMSAPTGSAPAWRLVAEREMTTRLRDKTFLGGVLFMLVLVIAGIALSAWLSGRAQTYDVAVVDETGA